MGEHWNQLSNMQQLEEIEDVSASEPVVLFKHSTRCSISRMALRNFQRDSAVGFPARLYYLDLLENREVSNAIANRFGITHQSPQIILIWSGRAAYHASHSDIDAETLRRKIIEVTGA